MMFGYLQLLQLKGLGTMPEVYGNYTLLEKLGEGDMGTTYKAQHPEQPAPLALKILDKVDTSNGMRRGAGVEILEFAATLQNPRIHPILAVLENTQAEHQLAVVMPLAPVGSFWDILQQGKSISPKQGFGILGQVATALQFFHQQDIAHGSVKPSNILFNKDGSTTVTDLPMAHLRELGFVPEEKSDQQLLFLTPEREYHAAPQPKDDVYSVAVLAYTLLTGKLPFNDPDPRARTEVVQGHNLPPAVAAVLRRAISPQTQWRYETLGDLMTALKGATKGEIDRDTERAFGVTPPPPADDEEENT